MKKKLIFALAGLAIAAVGFFQVLAPQARPLAQLMPGGALIYLEAKDFSALVRDWNGSGFESRWLASANYEMFSRSNLFSKLSDVFQEYATAAGFTPSMASVAQLAGGESALALYDIREVEFCYITRLTAAQAAQTRLWQLRPSFQSREAAGQPFYLRVDPASGRTVAFAVANGYLILATRDDLVAGALGLLANNNSPNIAADPWYRRSVDAAGAQGDLRMAMNLEALVDNSYFRSYWIQRNVSLVRQFDAGISDVDRSTREVVERRLFLRAPGGTAPEVNDDSHAAVADLLRLLPPNAGLARVWAQPETAAVSDLIVDKILHANTPRQPGPDYYAPSYYRESEAGSESDLETRIDDPPVSMTPAAFDATPIREMLQRAGLLAAAAVQSHRPRTGVTFIDLPTAVALAARQDWNAGDLQTLFGDAARRLWSLPSTGVTWQTANYRNVPTFALEGLGRIAFAARGRLLVLASDEAALRAVLDRIDVTATASDATYIAILQAGQERAPYVALTSALETSRPTGRFGYIGFYSAGAAEPAFFSANIASLVDTLRLTTVRLTQRERQEGMEQQVRYSLAP